LLVAKALAAAVLSMLAAGVTVAPQAAPQSASDLLDHWRQAVQAHEPGKPDDAARRIAGWSKSDLLQTINAIRRDDERSTALLNRGAVLHLDIELLFQPEATGALFPTDPRGRRTGVGQSTLLALDGRSRGQGLSPTHLQFARALLDAVGPAPSENETGQLWYAAAAAYLADRYNLAEALPHLQRGRELFPKSPAILLASGCVHETLASPRVQSVVREGLRSGRNVAVGTERRNLELAEGYFRAALKADPTLAEARLRLGRVVGLRGAHREAVKELERALSRPTDAHGLYFAHLFLGREQELLGRPEAARRHYERASALFPRAQSPHLALGRLAYHGGDPRQSERILQQLFGLREEGTEPVDPWWEYFSGQGRFVEGLLTRLHQHVTGEGR